MYFTKAAKSFLIIISLLLIFPILGSASPEKALDFELPSLDGRLYKLSDLKGRVVVINFWATWCPECIEEMPSLDNLYRSYKDKGLIILGISVDRKERTVREFITKNPVSYPILLDRKGDVFVKKYVVIGLPATYIIDKEGNLVKRYIGRQDFDSEAFHQQIERLLEGGNEG